MNWGVGKLALALYPFGAGAMAVNTFLGSLVSSWAGLPVLSPLASIFVGSAIAVPLTWLFARHIRRLMDKAEGDSRPARVRTQRSALSVEIRLSPRSAFRSVSAK